MNLSTDKEDGESRTLKFNYECKEGGIRTNIKTWEWRKWDKEITSTTH